MPSTTSRGGASPRGQPAQHNADLTSTIVGSRAQAARPVTPKAAKQAVLLNGRLSSGFTSHVAGHVVKKLGQAWHQKSLKRSFIKARASDCSRHVRLVDANGTVLLDAPLHLARLTPLRQLLHSDEQSSEVSSPANKDCAAEPGTEDQQKLEKGLQRSFSRLSCSVLREQRRVAPFDALRLCLECNFFKPCSVAFVRHLIMASGKSFWQGVAYPSGSVVYAEGELGHCMYVVSRGVAELTPKDKLRDPVELRAGDYFGAAQVLGVLSRRHETIVAKTSLHVLVVSSTTLSQILKRTPEDNEVGDPSPASPRCSRQFRHSEEIGSYLMGKFPPNGVVPPYVFMDERRHFERESSRIYLELGMPSAHSRGESRKVFKGNRLKLGDCNDDEVETTAEGSSDINCRKAALPVSCTSTPRRPAPDMAPRLFVKPQLEVRVPSSCAGETPRAASDASAVVDDALDVASHMGGTGLSERFAQRLVRSIRKDMRRGYMMPQDPLGVSGARDFGIALCDESSSPTAAEEDEDEEALKPDFSANLELRLLPPVVLMSATQKQSVLRQLQGQARVENKMKKAAYKARLKESSEKDGKNPSEAGDERLSEQEEFEALDAQK
mmetsp:Transcript_88324/g.248755  ORF Transcript_88324/g.248755 Transcript_88324/m.248755 type:complete len:609 (-) Transcript_88324:45-1871(-)